MRKVVLAKAPPPRPRRPRRVVLLGSCSLAVALWCVACSAPGPQPLGEPNPAVRAIADAGWMSADTITEIDPHTGAEQVRTYTSDLRPDTLAGGRIVYQITEYMPVFAGCKDDADPVLCTQTALAEYVNTHLRYRPRALAAGIEGRAVATFVIGADGRVGETGVERSLGDVLDSEVLRIVAGMPLWHPGFQDGRAVPVRYRLPVTFTLPEE